MAVRFAKGLYSLRSLRKNAVPVEDDFIKLLNELQNSLGVKRKIQLATSSRLTYPVSFGWRKPTILMQQNFADTMSFAEVRMTLIHEIAHFKRRDYLINIANSFLRIPLFFHPLFIFAQKQLQIQQEHICDDWVIQFSRKRTAYAQCLLRQAQVAILKTAPSVGTSVVSGFKNMRMRIDVILNKKRPLSINLSKKAAVFVLLICCVFTAFVATTRLLPPALVQQTEEEQLTARVKEMLLLHPMNVGAPQTEWEKYPGNPVLDLGAGGAWDDKHVYHPTVLFDGTEYKMWYTGRNKSNVSCRRIGYATSPDGIVWRRHPSNPVLNIGENGAWDDEDVSTPVVLFDDNMYKMWYGGNDGSTKGRYRSPKWRVGYATSPDGIVWKKRPKNYVFDVGPSGAWDDEAVFASTVLYDGIEYKMWYSGYDGSVYKIGYATSADGIAWKKYPGNPVLGIGVSGAWDDEHVYHPAVFFDGEKYKMWYSGHDGSKIKIGYAISFDGIVWKKHPNVVLDIGEGSAWDDYYVRGSTILCNGTKYEMWYEGYDGLDWRIGYATSPSGSISGTVTNIKSNPTSRALVIAIKKPDMKIAFTYKDGYYEITGLEPGEYLMTAITKGHKWAFAKVTVEPTCNPIRRNLKLKSQPRGENENEFLALPNFPNPFNLDTRIPYYLPQDADVAIEVYNSADQLVRTLNLGRKSAGFYLAKNKAAYWDGRDSLGEKVASGVYYYTLQAGEFRATRKMLIMK